MGPLRHLNPLLPLVAGSGFFVKPAGGALALAMGLMGPALQEAHPDMVRCAFRQLTDSVGGTGILAAAIDADGTSIAFASDRDLLGDGSNADGNHEMFLIDVTTGALAQLTDSVGGHTGDPQISADGRRIVFVSDRDLLGDGSNADGRAEIFLFDTTTGTLSQLTDIPGGRSWLPSLSADGTRITFSGGPEGQLFLLDLTTGALSQLTHLPYGVRNSLISGDGTRIALVSDDGSSTDEVFLFDTTTGLLSQVTDSLHSIAVWFSTDGTRIMLYSQSRDPLGGGDAGEYSPGYFLLDMTTGTLTQLTNVPTQSPLSVSGNGTRIAVSATADLLADGSNADGNSEIFLVDTTTGALAQLTDTVGGANIVLHHGMNADGSRFAFASDRDLLGNGTNPDGNSEIFLALCISGGDVDVIRGAVKALPGAAFAAPGHRTAMLAQLAAIRRDIIDGDLTVVVSRLQDLRRRVDGCEDGPPAGADDWLADCDAQSEIRGLIDALISNLRSLL